MKPRSIYIAGPMTGYKDYNFAAFDKARDKLNAEGWTVVSPADLDRENGFDALKGDSTEIVTKEFMKRAMRADLDALQRVDAIYMLTGWQDSKGATAEYHVAKWRQIDILFENGVVEIMNQDAEALNKKLNAEYAFKVKRPEPIGTDPKGEANVAKPAFRDFDIYGKEIKDSSGYEPVINPTDPKGEAGSKKAPMWLLPPFALEETAWVHGLGANKYGAWNFIKTKVCASTYISAIMRHLMAWHKRQDNDDESGKSHLAHIAACVNILMDAQHKGCLDDDRP